MSDRPLVLIVDDDPERLSAWEKSLPDAAYRFRFAATAERALAGARVEPPDGVVVSQRAAGPFDGLGLLARMNELRPGVAQVLLTGAPPVGVDRLRQVKVLLQPCGVEQLLATLQR